MDDFDKLNDLLDKMYYEKVPNPNSRKKDSFTKVMRVAKDDFMYTDEFNEICKLYPGYEDEFKYLITEYFGNTFSNIPSDILGNYCNLDAHYTLIGHLESKGRYDNECIGTYLDNLRLGARLHTGGMFKDENFRLRYREQCYKMMAYGITYASTIHCKMKSEHYYEKASDIVKLLSDECITLLKRNKFNMGNTTNIVRDIIKDNISNLYPSGLDEPKIMMDYGENIFSLLIDGLENLNVVADLSITRKRKVLTILGEKMSQLLNLPDNIDATKLEDTVGQYLYFKEGLDLMMDVWKNQMPDIYHIPDKFKLGNDIYEIGEYCGKLKKRYFNCTSPDDYPEIINFIMDKILPESIFLTSVYYNKNKLPGQDKYYKNKGIKTIEEAYSHFINHIGDEYPDDILSEAKMYSRDPYCENMTSSLDTLVGFWKQADFFDYILEGYDELTEPYSEKDFENKFLFMRKFSVMQQLYKKYNKMLTTYVEGLFVDNDRLVRDTNLLIPEMKGDGSDGRDVVKMFPKFLVCEKDTKRWSSPYHTIYGHSDVKKTIVAPQNYLLSYFDINYSVA